MLRYKNITVSPPPYLFYLASISSQLHGTVTAAGVQLKTDSIFILQGKLVHFYMLATNTIIQPSSANWLNPHFLPWL